jgi:hypothetical protein
MKSIKKYKTFKEAQFDLYLFEPDKKYIEMILSMHSMDFLNNIGKKIKKGVYKYKTFQDAQKDEMKWLLKD